MDDLTKFLNFLYEEQEGYVYVATKDPNKLNPTGNPEWKQEFFTWPQSKQEIEDYINLSQESLDVYVAPALFNKPHALKSHIKGSAVVWVEFDGQEQIDFDSSDIPQPDCIVQTSSPTHVHCYWKTPFSPTDVYEDVNRRLTYHLDADSTGWDAGQVLRPPNSKNWKHNGLPVMMAHFNNEFTKFEFKSFDAAPEVPTPVVIVQEASLEDPLALIAALDFTPSLEKKVTKEVPPVGARSSFIMRISYELAEEGLNHNQIVSLLNLVDNRIGKFVGRADRLLRLSEIASKAILQIDAEESLAVYSPSDILEYTEDLDWILPNWIHHSGFCIITGAPGVGKTTFGLQLLHHFSTGLSFLERQIPRELRVLFISLEMSVVELKYFFEHHQKGFEANLLEKWNENVKIIDQDARFGVYEELIAELNPSIILIDSLTEMAQEELKETESRAITRWIKKIRRRYNCAVVAIHHNRKQDSGKHKRPTKLSDLYGSFIFAKDVDTVLNLEQDEEDEHKIELSSLKTRYDKRVEMLIYRNENLIFDLVRDIENDDSSDTPRPGDTKFRSLF